MTSGMVMRLGPPPIETKATAAARTTIRVASPTFAITGHPVVRWGDGGGGSCRALRDPENGVEGLLKGAKHRQQNSAETGLRVSHFVQFFSSPAATETADVAEVVDVTGGAAVVEVAEVAEVAEAAHAAEATDAATTDRVSNSARRRLRPSANRSGWSRLSASTATDWASRSQNVSLARPGNRSIATPERRESGTCPTSFVTFPPRRPPLFHTRILRSVIPMTMRPDIGNRARRAFFTDREIETDWTMAPTTAPEKMPREPP